MKGKRHYRRVGKLTFKFLIPFVKAVLVDLFQPVKQFLKWTAKPFLVKSKQFFYTLTCLFFYLRSCGLPHFLIGPYFSN